MLRYRFGIGTADRPCQRIGGSGQPLRFGISVDPHAAEVVPEARLWVGTNGKVQWPAR